VNAEIAITVEENDLTLTESAFQWSDGLPGTTRSLLIEKLTSARGVISANVHTVIANGARPQPD